MWVEGNREGIKLIGDEKRTFFRILGSLEVEELGSCTSRPQCNNPSLILQTAVSKRKKIQGDIYLRLRWGDGEIRDIDSGKYARLKRRALEHCMTKIQS